MDTSLRGREIIHNVIDVQWVNKVPLKAGLRLALPRVDSKLADLTNHVSLVKMFSGWKKQSWGNGYGGGWDWRL